MFLRCLILFLTILYETKTEDTNVTIESGTLMPEDDTFTSAAMDDPPWGVNVTVTTTLAPEVPVHCNEMEWKCKEKNQCIRREQVCDGMINCQDASDEYLSLCKDNGEPRPMFGLVLHCSSSCEDYHEQLCPQICCHEPEYCYYALMAENNETNTCRLPSFPEHGNFSVKPFVENKPDFWLNYSCDYSYVVAEQARLECRNGTWVNDEVLPYCSEACKIKWNSNFTYDCPKSNNSTEKCGEFVAINSAVLVSRAELEPDADPNAPIIALPMLCKADKTFNLSEDCVGEVEKLQVEFEDPTMKKMTDYETKFNSFKTNETTSEFQTLVDEFHVFEKYVKGNLSMMHEMADKCDISLDLLIWDLSEKPTEKEDEKKPV